jgi:hypothetical protein
MGQPWNDQPTLFGEGSRPRERAPRAADPLWDALCFVCKLQQSSMTASSRGITNRALKELRDAGATPEDIILRSQAYVERFRSTPTPQALARQWPGLSGRPTAARRVEPRPVEALVSTERMRELGKRARSWLEERGP